MIWLIGGTSDANRIAAELQQEGYRLLISTTTTYGSQLASTLNCKVIEQKLMPGDMEELIRQQAITAVVDASHPFAEQVSTHAIAVCRKTGTPYLRFERQQVPVPGAQYYADYDALVEALRKTEGTILLTIGSKNVHRFCPFLTDRLVARILPVNESLEECRRAGLMAHQVLAMKGRVSAETNSALMQEYQIAHLVSKESGEAGGLQEKAQAAFKLGIPVHILSRPKLDYPRMFSAIQSLLACLKNELKIDN